jgi:hypothetical protein
VADKFDKAECEIFDACQDVITKKKSFNDQLTNAPYDDKDRLNFVEVIKSLYKTSSMVKYYIGDNPESISSDNRKLWPLRNWIYSAEDVSRVYHRQ